MADTLEFRYFSDFLSTGTYVADLYDAAGTIVVAGLAITELAAAKTRYQVSYVGTNTGHHTLHIRDTADDSFPFPAIDYVLQNVGGLRLPQSPLAVDVATIGAPAGASVSEDVAAIPTVSEFNARTIVSANYATATNLATVDTVADGIQTDLSNATDGLGALKTLIDDVPTVSEFNARTIVSADYFDPAADLVANVTLVGTSTNLTNLPSIPANWLTAAGIAASALNGKGDWNTVTPLTAAQTESEVNDALVVLHLDHLLAVNYDPAAIPGVATALFNELIENNAGVSRYTAAALVQAPSGGDATLAKQNTIISDVAAKPNLAEILAGGDVDGYTLEESLKLMLSALAGILAGANTTSVTIKAVDGSKTRITATVDGDGNRTVLVLDATG